MNSFAAIFIPQINETFFFEELENESHSMYIENFSATRKLSYKLRLNHSFPEFSLKNSNFTSISSEIYQAWVNDCIENIRSGGFSKLVAAQYQIEDINEEKLDWKILFQNLIHHLPNTFVYLYYIDGEVWLGASPELVGMCQEGIFKTISLAGTRSEEDFTAKEVEEQSIVSNFITSQFLKTKETSESKTQILPFGSIQHLINEYTFDIDENFDFEKAIHAIHPSPALSGMPKEKSIAFILANEPIKREFYSGLVSVSIDTKKYSFAIIRCARFSANQVRYYAGAGITIDSNPMAEWDETLTKIDVLKKALYN